jgi:hypothetical protein
LHKSWLDVDLIKIQKSVSHFLNFQTPLKMFFFLLSSVFGFLLLIKALKYYQEKRNLSKCVASIPGPKSYFLFSNMEVIRNQGKDCLPLHKKLLDQFKGICKVWVSTFIIVIIDDPDLVRDCLTSNNFSEKPFFYKFFRTPFGLLNSPCKL